jgi:hypothetical protein
LPWPARASKERGIYHKDSLVVISAAATPKITISQFLIAHYRPGNSDGNWIEPAWEYMHFHPALQSEHLSKIGIWEKNGQIVAVVHYEGNLGEAFFQFQPAYRYLREEMLDYAEKIYPGLPKKVVASTCAPTSMTTTRNSWPWCKHAAIGHPAATGHKSRFSGICRYAS